MNKKTIEMEKKKVKQRVYTYELGMKLVGRVMRTLRSIKLTMSGDDSGLLNVWDEICVQAQYEQSFYWEDVYKPMIEEEVEKRVVEMGLVAYFDEPEEEDDAHSDMLRDLTNDVMELAGKYENRRILKYIGMY